MSTICLGETSESFQRATLRAASQSWVSTSKHLPTSPARSLRACGYCQFSEVVKLSSNGFLHRSRKFASSEIRSISAVQEDLLARCVEFNIIHWLIRASSNGSSLSWAKSPNSP